MQIEDNILYTLKKAEPFYERYNKIAEMFYAPEVTTDSRWYNRLTKEYKEIENIAFLYENLKDFIASDKNEEKQAFYKLYNELLTELYFYGQEESAGAEIFISGGNQCKNEIDLVRNAYFKYVLIKKFKVKEEKLSEGKIISSKLNCKGKNLYSYLKNESGLLQIIDKNGLKKSIEILVMPPKESNFKFLKTDVRIEVSHSGGAGGQNVNKVATAIRAVHIPTNIAVSCQDERSQFENKEKALARLKERVLEYYKKSFENSYNEKLLKSTEALNSKGIIRKIDYTAKVITDLNSGINFPLEKFIVGDIDELIKVNAL